ncbi:hypothetical protein [Methylobacterium sp.]|uniref:PGN_0703 family putative restriction endonuclease n=1 Tax=Methylobacterium sp. TaxID=409 RepID=UPI0034555469
MPTSPTPSSAAPRATSLAIHHAGQADVSAQPVRAVCTETPLRIVPFVPEAVLHRYHAFVASDGRFTSASRLLAALWRQDQGLPLGTYIPEPRRGSRQTQPSSLLPKLTRLGSRLSPAAARAGATFLSPAIASYARQALLFREVGSLWEEGRLWGNLLSSQAMTLNLLAPMALDLDFATAVWRILLPSFVHQVSAVRFETSPGRRGPEYFGDGTAFDVLLDVITPDGEPAFVTMEVKYVEGMTGLVPPPRPRYKETARESNLFIDPEATLLTQPGFEQLRREHVMIQLMVRQGLAARAHFILLGPALNRRVHAVGKLYADQLQPIDPDAGSDKVGFSTLSLEAVVAAMTAAGAGEIATAFYSRYLDANRVVRCVLDTPLPRLSSSSPAQRAGCASAPTAPTALTVASAKSTRTRQPD